MVSHLPGDSRDHAVGIYALAAATSARRGWAGTPAPVPGGALIPTITSGAR